MEMAFSTTYGNYKYEYVMPYGPSCAPLVFQCLISYVLKDILDKFFIAYIDDILTKIIAIQRTPMWPCEKNTPQTKGPSALHQR